MEPKKIKKLVLKKETISNLSKFEQGMIIGGDSYFCSGLVQCPSRGCVTGNNTCLVGGGTCDSTVNWDVTCTGNC